MLLSTADVTIDELPFHIGPMLTSISITNNYGNWCTFYIGMLISTTDVAIDKLPFHIEPMLSSISITNMVIDVHFT